MSRYRTTIQTYEAETPQNESCDHVQPGSIIDTCTILAPHVTRTPDRVRFQNFDNYVSETFDY